MWAYLQDLTKQLDEVTQDSEIVEIRQKESECELEAARDRVQQQATEILLKASKDFSPVSSNLLPGYICPLIYSSPHSPFATRAECTLEYLLLILVAVSNLSNLNPLLWFKMLIPK